MRPRRVLAALRVALVSGLLAIVVVIGVLTVLVPAVTGSETYTILTSSMKPNLPPGTLVVVRPVHVPDLHSGDVITYQLASGKPTVVTHRIVKVMVSSDASREFITRGDNNAVADTRPVRPAQIKGKLWYAIPSVGWLATLRTTSTGTTALTIAGWALLAYGVGLVAWRVARRDHPRRDSRAPIPPERK